MVYQVLKYFVIFKLLYWWSYEYVNYVLTSSNQILSSIITFLLLSFAINKRPRSIMTLVTLSNVLRLIYTIKITVYRVTSPLIRVFGPDIRVSYIQGNNPSILLQGTTNDGSLRMDEPICKLIRFNLFKYDGNGIHFITSFKREQRPTNWVRSI